MMMFMPLLSKFRCNKNTPFQKEYITGIKIDSSTNTSFRQVLENRRWTIMGQTRPAVKEVCHLEVSILGPVKCFRCL